MNSSRIRVREPVRIYFMVTGDLFFLITYTSNSKTFQIKYLNRLGSYISHVRFAAINKDAQFIIIPLQTLHYISAVFEKCVNRIVNDLHRHRRALAPLKMEKSLKMRPLGAVCLRNAIKTMNSLASYDDCYVSTENLIYFHTIPQSTQPWNACWRYHYGVSLKFFPIHFQAHIFQIIMFAS